MATAWGELEGDPENLDLAQLYVREHVAWSPEHRGWFVTEGTDEDGNPRFAYTSKPEAGKPPFKGVAEFLQEIEASGKRKSWFKPRQRDGSGYRPGCNYNATCVFSYTYRRRAGSLCSYTQVRKRRYCLRQYRRLRTWV